MKILLILLGILFFCSSCASIVSKSTYPVHIDSDPSGVKFEVRDEYGAIISRGKTPWVVTLDASEGYFSCANYSLFFYDEDGKMATTRPLNAKLDMWYIGNFLFGGLIGLLIVDPATGAMWKLPPRVFTHIPMMQ